MAFKDNGKKEKPNGGQIKQRQSIFLAAMLCHYSFVFNGNAAYLILTGIPFTWSFQGPIKLGFIVEDILNYVTVLI